eukprot:Amastigsp_a213683_7.p4 type:complete len:102 gc:universal Amastigsp_a213683_7:442-137(-)
MATTMRRTRWLRRLRPTPSLDSSSVVEISVDTTTRTSTCSRSRFLRFSRRTARRRTLSRRSRRVWAMLCFSSPTPRSRSRRLSRRLWCRGLGPDGLSLRRR